MPVPPQVEPMANAAMGVGLGSLLVALIGGCCCMPLGWLGAIAGVVAVVLGVLARRNIAAAGGRKPGSNQALTGLITGGIGIVLSLGLTVVNLVAGFNGLYNS